VDLSSIIKISVCNNTCAIVFGRRFEYDDHNFAQYMQHIEESFRLTSGEITLEVEQNKYTGGCCC
jgi:hypothetical protein